METQDSKFIHLHTHSHYSLLTALPKIDELISAAKENNMSSLALTDNGNMYGAIEFYKKCKKEDIKPILGVDFYVALQSRKDKRAGIDNKRFRFVLLAKNENGYKNLIKLVTESNTDGFYYKPRIDHELMKKYSDGLIAIIPQFSGETTDKIKNKNFTEAKKILDIYQDIYKNNLYLEIAHHPEIEGQIELKKNIIKISKETGIPLVASHDVYYIKPEDRDARNTLMSVQNVVDFSQNRRLNKDDEDFSFISQETAEEYFRDIPEALKNISKIVNECNLELTLGDWVFPNVQTTDGATSPKELKNLIERGLKDKQIKKTNEIQKRIDYEYNIIKDKGYCPYFVAVADLLRYAHENNIYTNTRGSAAGSLVSFLVGITNINPLEYNIPFERFLNPERPSPPDIDIDIADDKRDEMIDYAKRKYGEDKVAQIGTFGTMAARGSIRDVARALGYPYEIGDKIAKQIPLGKQGFPMTIDRALSENSELKKMYVDDKDVKKVVNMAKKIEGCARHISVHAAGVVISPTPLTDFVPIQLDPKGGKLITQYDMHCVEEAGLLKFDFLGLKNLKVLADSIRLVEKIRNKKIDIQEIPLDDKKTFEMLARGETMGVFQLASDGMTKYLTELKPTKITDINAMIALYRPGPIAFIPDYIKRKENPQYIKYIDPRMEKFLGPTYGIIVYQDDVLLLANEFAGYTLAQADLFRKAIGKKIPEVMQAQKEKFIKGCIENGMEPNTAKKLWDMIETFAAYGFNKAHAASYGKVSYQTAYMKANFPVVYMSALLTADSGDVDKIFEIVEECKRMNIEVLSPNINESFADFTVLESTSPTGPTAGGPSGVGDKIRFGLCSVKNFGEGITNVIIEERKLNGKFKSLSDFLERVLDRNLNKKSLEALIKCGAMDELGERGEMLKNMENLLLYNKENAKTEGPQDSLFGLMSDSSTVPKLKLEKVTPATQDEKLAWEKELLGLYISGHPLDKFREKLEQRKYTIKKIKEELEEEMIVAVAGMIEDSRVINTKKGDQMAFIQISDLTGTLEIVAFPKIYKEFRELLQPTSYAIIKGRISHRNQSVSLIAEAIKKFE